MKQIIDTINAELARINAASAPSVRGDLCASDEGGGLVMFADGYAYPMVTSTETARQVLATLQAMPDGAGFEAAWGAVAKGGVEADSDEVEGMVEDAESSGVEIDPAAWLAARRAA